MDHKICKQEDFVRQYARLNRTVGSGRGRSRTRQKEGRSGGAIAGFCSYPMPLSGDPLEAQVRPLYSSISRSWEASPAGAGNGRRGTQQQLLEADTHSL